MKYIQNKMETVVEYNIDETGALVYVPDTEETHVFNETAYFIFNVLKTPCNVESIYKKMDLVYNISGLTKESVINDIQGCLNMLCEKGLVCTIDEIEEY